MDREQQLEELYGRADEARKPAKPKRERTPEEQEAMDRRMAALREKKRQRREEQAYEALRAREIPVPGQTEVRHTSEPDDRASEPSGAPVPSAMDVDRSPNSNTEERHGKVQPSGTGDPSVHLVPLEALKRAENNPNSPPEGKSLADVASSAARSGSSMAKVRRSDENPSRDSPIARGIARPVFSGQVRRVAPPKPPVPVPVPSNTRFIGYGAKAAVIAFATYLAYKQIWGSSEEEKVNEQQSSMVSGSDEHSKTGDGWEEEGGSPLSVDRNGSPVQSMPERLAGFGRAPDSTPDTETKGPPIDGQTGDSAGVPDNYPKVTSRTKRGPVWLDPNGKVARS